MTTNPAVKTGKHSMNTRSQSDRCFPVMFIDLLLVPKVMPVMSLGVIMCQKLMVMLSEGWDRKR